MSTFHKNSGHDWLGLGDRVCVVTGGASGIGAAVAHGLAAVGARVALLDLDAAGCEEVAQDLNDHGARAISIACDTTDEKAIEHAAQRIEKEFGPCYALINNAGMMRSAALSAVTLEDWNKVLAVNLTGYLLCARTFARRMEKTGQGSLVHIASIAGKFPQAGSGAYSASKAGVMLLSREMAVEWGAQGIRSNVICPGMIRTPLTADFYMQPGVEQARSAMTACRRVGTPEDIANTALFLASPRSSYVTGAELMVDGGMSSMLMDMVPRPGFNRVPGNG